MDASDVSGTLISEPCLNMEFGSHEDAYSFYKEYAKAAGFGTAKLSSRRSRASKEFIDAKFSCIRYGNKQQSDDAVNPRPSPKIGCKASMHVKRRLNGKWYIYSLVKEHNHELLPDQAHFFRSHRNSDPITNDVKLRRRKNASALTKHFSAYQNLDFLNGFIRNQHDKGRRLVLEAGDAQLLLEFFMCMQEENPEFFYAIDFNEENRLRNVFWVDAKGIEDYKSFGDVVSLDTSYFASKYKLPLVFYLGVNHHAQPILLGCGLIADETVYTFVWLMQTWLTAMGDSGPKVILTDQNNAVKSAVSAVLPETQHCFSLWHVLERLPQNLDYWSLWQEPFLKKFYKCIYKSWTEEEFEKRWWKLLDKFHLRDVQWVQLLYEERRYWVPTFMRGISFSGLSTSTRAESLVCLFDKYVQPETSLKEFMERYKVMLEDRYEEEAKADFDAWHETPELRSPSPFEKQMSLIYTHGIFRKFQVEVLGAAACHLKKENENETATTYSVKDFENDQNFIVEWNESESSIYCSCRSFEYKGYLCRHAIVVLQMSGVFSIPSNYVQQRWTNVARSRIGISENMDEVQSKVRRFNGLCRRAIILGEEGSLSQESYDFAVCAITEARKQCTSVNNNTEYQTRCMELANRVEEENQCGTVSKEKVMDCSNRALGRTRTGQDKECGNSSASRKGKESRSGAEGSGSQDGIHQMEASRQMQDPMPPQFHSILPAAMFHSVVPTQFQNVHTTAHMQQSHLPR